MHVFDIILHTHVASPIPHCLISTFLDHHIQLNLSTIICMCMLIEHWYCPLAIYLATRKSWKSQVSTGASAKTLQGCCPKMLCPQFQWILTVPNTIAMFGTPISAQTQSIVFVDFIPQCFVQYISSILNRSAVLQNGGGSTSLYPNSKTISLIKMVGIILPYTPRSCSLNSVSVCLYLNFCKCYWLYYVWYIEFSY